MKKISKVAFTAMISISVFIALVGCENEGVLKRAEAYSKSLKSFRADITLLRYDSQIGKTEKSKGKFLYVPQKDGNISARIDLTSPQELLIVSNKRFVSYRPRINVVYVGKLDQPQTFAQLSEALIFMNMSKEKLKSDYNIKYLSEEKAGGGILTHHLEFTPKTTKNYYKSAELWIDDNGTPIQMKANLNYGDSLTASFSNIEKNVNFNTEDFKFSLPKGARVLRVSQ